MVDVAVRYWKACPSSQGPLEAICLDDKANDTIQRSIAIWVYPLLSSSSATNESLETNESCHSQKKLDTDRLIMFELMLRRHWRVRTGNKKSANLWNKDDAPFGLLACVFILPEIAVIVNHDQLKYNELIDVLATKIGQHYANLQSLKEKCEQEPTAIQKSVGFMYVFFFRVTKN